MAQVNISPIEIPYEVRLQLEKKKYAIVGRHSAVQICEWTKKALRREGVCYKNIFYGIETHRCAEMSPMAMMCNENCIFCWRPMEFMRYIEIKEEYVNDPQSIIEEVIEKRKKLLSGFKGNENVDKKLLEEALIPSHWAISLSGEPTLYPKLPELISLLKKRKEVKSIFLVTNAQEYEMFEKLYEKKALPHQIYVSIDAPNEELFKRINRPVHRDGWQRLMKSLDILAKLPVRRVARFTMIKDMNDNEKYLEDYSKLFTKGNFDFIEVKAYMHIGYSRRRLTQENMPTFQQVKEFAHKLLNYLPHHRYEDDVPISRISLIMNEYSPFPRFLIPPVNSEERGERGE